MSITEETMADDLYSQPVSSLVSTIKQLTQDAQYVHNSAYEDGLMKSYKVLTQALIDNLGVEDSEEDRETAEEVMNDFLSGINKSHWSNPFANKKWDVEVELNDKYLNVTITAESEEEAVKIVTDGLKVTDKRQSWKLSFRNDEDTDYLEVEYEDESCEFDDDFCTDGIRVSASPSQG
jgi:hypothetical protein